jgi:hypothetical protein
MVVFRLLRRIVPTVAVILLAWTAVDLVDPQCCLREMSASSSTTAAAGGAVHTAQPDFDDCFCCARCIDTGTRVPEMRTPVSWVEFAEPIRHVSTRPTVLDHPPQNA